MEPDAPGKIRVEYTIQRDDVVMHVRIEGIAEPLDKVDAATLRVEVLALGAALRRNEANNVRRKARRTSAVRPGSNATR